MKHEPLTNGLLVDKKEKTLKIVSQRFWLDLKEKVEWLLKEIEKKKENVLAYALLDNSKDKRYSEFIVETLSWFEDLIKKAFSGVVEG